MNDSQCCVQVVTTTDAKEAAERLARHLVEQSLAACVQIVGPITSVYRWQGKLETAEEWLCAAKTTAERYTAVEEAIRQVHSYEVPEIVAFEIQQGSNDYLTWLRQQVAREQTSRDSGG